jgi:hypothetical protein
MKLALRVINVLYRGLLRFYPRRIRADFGTEMQQVFSDAAVEASRHGKLAMAKIILKELHDFPFLALQWHWQEMRQEFVLPAHEKDIPMNAEQQPSIPAATPVEVAVGMLPFLFFGLVLIGNELPREWNMSGWLDSVGRTVFFLLLLLPAIGFAAAWVRNFPRWSYPYVGMAFVMAVFQQTAATPGLNLFGYPIFGRELWGWRAWIPLGAAFFVALAVSRSLKPAVRFFTNLWQDWSTPSYLMAGLLPLIVAVAFDEMDRLYSLYFMVPFAALLVGMVIFYLRGHQAWQRVLALTAVCLIILAATALGINSYWLAHNGMSAAGARRTLNLAGIIALIMLLPAWLELLRGSARRVRAI